MASSDICDKRRRTRTAGMEQPVPPVQDTVLFRDVPSTPGPCLPHAVSATQPVNGQPSLQCAVDTIGGQAAQTHPPNPPPGGARIFGWPILGARFYRRFAPEIDNPTLFWGNPFCLTLLPQWGGWITNHLPPPGHQLKKNSGHHNLKKKNAQTFSQKP